MNVLWMLVDWVREDVKSIRESHAHPHTGEIDHPEVLAEIEAKEYACGLAEVALAALGLQRDAE
jgi:hypothetical protein